MFFLAVSVSPSRYSSCAGFFERARAHCTRLLFIMRLLSIFVGESSPGGPSRHGARRRIQFSSDGKFRIFQNQSAKFNARDYSSSAYKGAWPELVRYVQRVRARTYLCADLYYEGMYALALPLCIRVELQMAKRGWKERERERAKNPSEFRIRGRALTSNPRRLPMFRCRACASFLFCARFFHSTRKAAVDF